MIRGNQDLPELPKGWVWTELKNCVEILDGKRVPVNAKDREVRIAGKTPSELLPYFGATGQVGWIDDFLFDEELVLLGEDGAPFLDPLRDKAYVIRGKTWVNNHAHVLRALSGMLSSAFLCHYLNTVDYHGYVTGTTRLKLDQAPMRKIAIPLAPYQEQKRIVARVEELLTKLDAGVEGLRRVKAQLQRYRQAVLKSAFEGKLTEEWRKTHRDQIGPIGTFLEQINEMKGRSANAAYEVPLPVDTSRLPQLPENWVWIRLGQISRAVEYGTSEKARSEPVGIPVLRMGNIQDGKLVFEDLRYLPQDWSQLSDLVLEGGDVLFNRTNSFELVGKTAVYKKHHPRAVFASYLIRVRVIETAYIPDILSFFINSIYGRRYISSVVSQQVGQANVNGRKLSLMPIPLIPFQEQHAILDEINQRFSTADSTQEAVEQGLAQAERLRHGILSKAFRGKLAPQDPTEEPAERLLGRIRNERSQKMMKKKPTKLAKKEDILNR